jgi:hypothetical protein
MNRYWRALAFCSRADLPLRTLRLSNFLRCHRYSGRFMTTTAGSRHNVIASARYPSSWTIKATSISISRPVLWSFGVCANSSVASIGSMSATSTAPCHTMHALGPRALRRANHIHARHVGKEEAEVIIRRVLIVSMKSALAKTTSQVPQTVEQQAVDVKIAMLDHLILPLPRSRKLRHNLHDTLVHN